MTTPTFDSVSSFVSVVGATSISFTDVATVGSALILWVGFATNGTNTVSAAYTGGIPLTQIGSTISTGVVGTTNSYMAAFKLAATPGGGSVTFTVASSATIKGVVVSYTNCTVGGTLASLAQSTGLSFTLGSVASASGHRVTNVILQMASPTSTFSAYTQTQRGADSPGTGAWLTTYIVGDAAGAATVSFGVTSNVSSGTKWGGMAVDLSPPPVAKIPPMSRVPIMRSALY